MPYASDKQRRFMHARHPEIAARWDAEIRAQKRSRRRIRKSADPYFDEEAAQWAYDLISKMDPDEAEMLATFVIADTLWETIEKNHRTLSRHLNQVIAKRAARMEHALLRMEAKGAPAEEIAKMAGALEEISKATLTPQDYGWVFRESDVRRDPGGRFTFKVDIPQGVGVVPKRQAEKVPRMPVVEDEEKLKNLGWGPDAAKKKARYQQGYMQVANFLDSVPMSEDDSVIWTIRDNKVNGRMYRKVGNGTEIPDIDPDTEEFAGVEVKRPRGYTQAEAEQPVGGMDAATFSLITALANRARPAYGDEELLAQNRQLATRGVQQMKTLNENLPSFSEDWLKAGATGETEGSSNARLYGRLAVGSEILGAFQEPGSPAWVATKFAEFAGHQAPEAEKVLGPKIRRTMYRYRGIEKKPEPEIVNEYERAKGTAGVMRTPEQQAQYKQLQGRALAQAKRRKGSDLTPSERKEVLAGVSAQTQGITGAPEEAAGYLSARGQTKLIELMNERIPDAMYYDLQLKAGHTPPSEGLIINKDGKIITQAVGYADDHYLPFNLANLKGLRGGSYIRTRSVGGPTTEDIYTGLVAGAEQLIVTSRSGTFVVTFDDTFRGTRRYNDKAGRMVKRYGKILDAVQSKQASRMQLEPDLKRQIREEVDRTYGTYGSGELRNKAIQAKEKEYKLYPRISTKDSMEIENTAAQMEAAGNPRGAQEFRVNATNHLLEQKAYQWQLNGDGYAAAIRSLKEQFPYYIKDVQHIPRRDLARFEAEPDKGYVMARHLRPVEALEGYFDTAIAGESQASANKDKRARTSEDKATGKTPAAFSDYANWRNNPLNPDVTPQTKPGTETEIEGGTEGAKKPESADAKRLANLKASEQAENQARDAAVIWEGLRGVFPANHQDAGQERTLPQMKQRTEFSTLFNPNMTKDEFITQFPQHKKAFDALLSTITDPTTTLFAPELTALQNYKRAETSASTAFDRTKGHLDVTPAKPFTFEGDAYLDGADPNMRQGEMRRLDKDTVLPSGKALNELRSDADFASDIQGFRRLRARGQLVKEAEDPAKMIHDLIQANELPSSTPDLLKQMMMADPTVLENMQENTLRYWALRQRESAGEPGMFERYEREVKGGPEAPGTTPPRTSPTPRGPTTPPAAPLTQGPEPAGGRPAPATTPAQMPRRKPQPKIETTATSKHPVTREVPAEPVPESELDLDAVIADLPLDLRDEGLKRSEAFRQIADKFTPLAESAKQAGEREAHNDLRAVASAMNFAAKHPISPLARENAVRVLKAQTRKYPQIAAMAEEDLIVPDPWKDTRVTKGHFMMIAKAASHGYLTAVPTFGRADLG